MTTGSLPEEGELRLGPVTLPAGKRVHAGYESAVPVAWVTLEEVPDAGRVWAALSGTSQETGLVPILLGGLAMDPAQLRAELGPVDVTRLDHMDAATLGLLGAAARPWDEEEFGYPADATQLDHMDAASLLESWWDGKTHDADEAGDEYTRRHFETAQIGRAHV